jgi:hypothetical protein
MSIDTSASSDVSVTHLLTGIIADAQDLGVKHLELIRSELLEEIRQTTEALVSLAIGFALIQIGGLLFSHMFANLLVQVFPSLALWQGYAIVGVVVAICGAVPLILGISRLRAIRPLTHSTTRVS